MKYMGLDLHKSEIFTTALACRNQQFRINYFKFTIFMEAIRPILKSINFLNISSPKESLLASIFLL